MTMWCTSTSPSGLYGCQLTAGHDGDHIAKRAWGTYSWARGWWREDDRMEFCPRCKCCSLHNGQCNGNCAPCGHHAECPRCEQNDRMIEELATLLESHRDDLRAFQKKHAW